MAGSGGGGRQFPKRPWFRQDNLPCVAGTVRERPSLGGGLVQEMKAVNILVWAEGHLVYVLGAYVSGISQVTCLVQNQM